MGASQSSPSPSLTSIHQFTVKDPSGRDVDLGSYKGKVLLVVNVASKCGFTDSNYTQLSELYKKYKGKVDVSCQLQIGFVKSESILTGNT